MTCILGISAFYHGSAAALIVDGDIVAAAQEERLAPYGEPRYAQLIYRRIFPAVICAYSAASRGT